MGQQKITANQPRQLSTNASFVNCWICQKTNNQKPSWVLTSQWVSFCSSILMAYPVRLHFNRAIVTWIVHKYFVKTHVHKKMECYFQQNFNPLCTLTSHVVSTLPNLSHYINRSQLCAIFKSILCCQKSNVFVHLCRAIQVRGGDNCKSTISRLLRKWMSKSKKVTTKHNRNINL